MDMVTEMLMATIKAMTTKSLLTTTIAQEALPNVRLIQEEIGITMTKKKRAIETDPVESNIMETLVAQDRAIKLKSLSPISGRLFNFSLLLIV
jgi:hypothetical protein